MEFQVERVTWVEESTTAEDVLVLVAPLDVLVLVAPLDVLVLVAPLDVLVLVAPLDVLVVLEPACNTAEGEEAISSSSSTVSMAGSIQCLQRVLR